MDKYSITANILSRISTGTGNAEAEPGKPVGQKILAVDCTGSSMNNVMNLKKYGFDVTVVGQDGEPPANLAQSCKEYDFILVPALTQEVAVKLSVGLLDEACSKWIWGLLWVGRTVYADMTRIYECFGCRTENAAMKTIVDNCKKTLIAMGIVELSSADFIKLILNKNEQPVNCKKSETNGESCCRIIFGQDLITERDIAGLKDGVTELNIGPQSVITPLAKDALRRKGINLNRRQ